MTTDMRVDMNHEQTIPHEALEMAHCLAEAFRPERIYLFGSVARGDATSDSDYDFMVIVPASNQPQYRRSQEAHRVLSRFNAAKDVLVWTREEFDRRAHLVASLPATILREGILLYGG